MSQEVVAALGSASERLAERVIASMYEDPFWQARYGERGHQHALEDARYHVSYLCQTVAAEDLGIFTRYAAWLRSVLVSRGMCSRHLDDSFRKLARALSAELPDAGASLEVLEEGRRALRYREGLAGELEAQGPALSSELSSTPAFRALGGVSASATPPYHLSYLADALEAGRPDFFVGHVRWFAAFLAQKGVASEVLVGALEALCTALEHAPLSPALRERALGTLAEARGALHMERSSP